jgi:hypothetical protein
VAEAVPAQQGEEESPKRTKLYELS